MPDADRVLSNEELMAEVHAMVERLRAILQTSEQAMLDPTAPPALAPALHTAIPGLPKPSPSAQPSGAQDDCA